MILNFHGRNVESIEIDGEEGVKYEHKFDERFGRLMIKVRIIKADKNENTP